MSMLSDTEKMIWSWLKGLFKSKSKRAYGICKCTQPHEVTDIGFWEKCPLTEGRHTMFALHRCRDCGKVSGFPQANLDIALEKGTEEVKSELNSIIFGEGK